MCSGPMQPSCVAIITWLAMFTQADFVCAGKPPTFLIYSFPQQSRRIWSCLSCLLHARQLGCSSILSVVLEDGSLCIVDVSPSPANQPSPKARRAALQQALSTPSTARCNWVLSGGGVAVDAVTVVLLSPEPLGSSVLLRQPWVMLLRYLVQVRGQ